MKNYFRIHLFLLLKSFLVFAFCTLFLNISNLYPCTSAVISGKITPDGRPLLWKNRDTSDPNNKVVFLKGEKYSFIGVINSTDMNALHVWQGINSQGFAIMNTNSTDLSTGPGTGGQNGIFMKRALGECADVAEFEELLNRTNGQRNVATNYGVIDARGRACFFETRNDSFVKYDANNPKDAPQGFIVRTNFAFSAPKKNQGGGYIRHERDLHILEEAAARKRITHRFILQEAARDLINAKLHSDPYKQVRRTSFENPLYINTSDTINRNSTVSVSVFHGAPSPEKASLATMWVLLGQPVTSVAVPLWVHAQGVPEEMTGENTAPMNDLARQIVSFLYDDSRGHMGQYMNVTKLLKYGRKGILDTLYKIENNILAETEAKLDVWSKGNPKASDMLDFEKRITSRVYRAIRQSFPGILRD